MFEVEIDPEVFKELRALKKGGQGHIGKRLFEAARSLGKDPYTPRPGLDIKPLKGSKGRIYRLRIGKYRALYEVLPEAKIIRFTVVARHHKGY